MKALAAMIALLWFGCMAMAEERIYTVQKGDTLEKIAQTQLDEARLWPQLAKYNSLDDPDLIKVGQNIVVPSKSQLLVSNQAKSELEARIAALERLVRQYQGSSGELIFADSFEEGTLAKKPAGWLFPSSGKWGISDQVSWVLSQTDRKAGNSAAVTGKQDWSNYTVQVELQVKHSGDAGVFAYWNSYLENYRLRTDKRRQRIELVKRAPTGPDRYNTLVLNHVPFQLVENRRYVFKLEVTSHSSYAYLKGKVWEKGRTEPGTWQLEASDHTAGRYTSGLAGVWTIGFGTSYRGAQFDNFQIFRVER